MYFYTQNFKKEMKSGQIDISKKNILQFISLELSQAFNFVLSPVHIYSFIFIYTYVHVYLPNTTTLYIRCLYFFVFLSFSSVEEVASFFKPSPIPQDHHGRTMSAALEMDNSTYPVLNPEKVNLDQFFFFHSLCRIDVRNPSVKFFTFSL